MTEVEFAVWAERENRAWFIQAERRRCVGILLRAIGEYRLAKRIEVAAALERLATEMEHPEGER